MMDDILVFIYSLNSLIQILVYYINSKYHLDADVYNIRLP